MIPLVSTVAELAKLREVAEIIAEVAAEEGVELDIEVGTMIELPRAAVTADEIATQADFFSFGTNDLTQTTFGFSRDDVEAEFVPQYLQEHLLPFNPFATIDPGVAKLVKMGVELGHEGNPDLVCGVCGEHGGDPDSIHTFNEIGLDYVLLLPTACRWPAWLPPRLRSKKSSTTTGSSLRGSGVSRSAPFAHIMGRGMMQRTKIARCLPTSTRSGARKSPWRVGSARYAI